MASNLVLRAISSVVIVVLTLGCLTHGLWLKQTFLIMLWSGMIFEWICTTIRLSGKRYTWLLGGIAYISLPMIFWILRAYSPYNEREDSVLLLWVFVLVWVTDAFAYIGGSIIGGRKMAPNISPNKTWSGAITGALAALIVCHCLLPVANSRGFVLLPPLTLCALMTPIIIAAICGDLLESKVKRVLMIKDFGRLIPGHGGLCDRMDSFLLASYAVLIIEAFL
jgi:phosphatidate cytidylyltransferase